MNAAPSDPSRTVTWHELYVETAARLGSAAEARWLCESASGCSGGAWTAALTEPATRRCVATLDAMLARREAGEPLQYVLGAWGFRTLDLAIDRRVLIPRAETEQVVDVALAEARRRRAGLGRPLRVADLGTGSGAIALSVAAELPIGAVEVWATDASPGALAVASANLAGAGRIAAFVQLAEGSWYKALPDDLRGRLDVVVSNPPYIAIDDPEVTDAVVEWEPADALFAGPDGLDALRTIIAGAPQWLEAGGALVCEIGARQGEAVGILAATAGLVDVEVRPDLAGHDRILVAHCPAERPGP
jgi:release factor glutamine methyltransferase